MRVLLLGLMGSLSLLAASAFQGVSAQETQPQRIGYKAPPELEKFVSDWAELLTKYPDAATRYSLLDRQRAKSISGLEVRMFCFPDAHQICIPDPIPLPEMPQ